MTIKLKDKVASNMTFIPPHINYILCTSSYYFAFFFIWYKFPQLIQHFVIYNPIGDGLKSWKYLNEVPPPFASEISNAIACPAGHANVAIV